jgi:putative hydrolase of the HAD superfamily
MTVTLVFDADDTLWENNIHFENVIADFVRWVSHPVLDAAAIRAVLDEIERDRAVTHGYGSHVFRGSLVRVFEKLEDRPATAEELAEIVALCAVFEEHELELLVGVPETLAALATRHPLLLLTKGHPPEQQKKIDASGLSRHFRSTHIVPEKNGATYATLAAELGLDPATTWMIGNSPKSDIIAARDAGWNAVFIPNANTWVLEDQPLDPGDGRVLRLGAFPELLEHF